MEKQIKNLEILIESNPTQRVDLFSGIGGDVLFWAYKNSINEQTEYITQLENSLEKCFSLIENEEPVFSFSSGISGFGWIVESLTQKKYINADTNAVFEGIDEDVEEWMMQEMNIGNYDFMHGALGAGLYFLKRALSKPSLNEKINLLVECLISKAVYFENGSIAWKQLANGSYIKEDNYNFGLSHGIPSILVFLVKVYQQGIARKKIFPIISGATRFILQHQQDFKSKGFYFPYNVDLDGSIQNSSRLAWCYGDLGTCCALWHVNTILNDTKLEENILNILVDNASIREARKCGIVDACFCHGSVGIAHIFKRFYHRYNHPLLLEASDYWYQITKKMATFDDGLGGYKTYHPQEFGGWQNDYGLLEGISGIAGSLQYATTNEEPFWDEALLIS